MTELTLEPQITQNSSLPWWRTDHYTIDSALPPGFDPAWAGPRGIALVRAWPNGKTDPGWGLNPPKKSTKGFMPRYMSGQFEAKWVMAGYEDGKHIFAYVMRSMRLVAIDIDGKNGGLEAAKRLGPLPPTLAEISKSGTGYHLFYLVDDVWDDEKGYGLLGDRIGIEQGVDIRSTGCIYHHPKQRWNDRAPAKLPAYLQELILTKDQKTAAAHEQIVEILNSKDTEELMMLHIDLITALKKPIPEGKRNNTLFAIGQQMRMAEVPQWDVMIRDRAIQIGLPADETAKLIANIERYAE